MSRRKRPQSFAEMAADVPVYSKSMDGRHQSRLLGDGLWDEEGLFWQAGRGLALGEAENLLRQGNALVTADARDSSLRFIPKNEALGAWERLIADAALEHDPHRYWVPWLFHHGDKSLVMLEGHC